MIGVLVGLAQLFMVCDIAGWITLTVACIGLYILYVPRIVDHFDAFDYNPDGTLKPAKLRVFTHRYYWGMVVTGGFIILGLLALDFVLIMELFG